MESVHLAYLCGLFDGEGSVTLTKGRHGRYDYFSPRLTICMTDAGVMKWLDVHVPCGHIRRSRQLTKGGRYQYYWEVSRQNDIHELLPLMLQFLVSRRERAELLLQFVTIHKLHRRRWEGRDLEKEMQIYAQIRHFNHHRQTVFSPNSDMKLDSFFGSKFCGACGVLFRPNNMLIKYCSEDCRRSARMEHQRERRLKLAEKVAPK